MSAQDNGGSPFSGYVDKTTPGVTRHSTAMKGATTKQAEAPLVEKLPPLSKEDRDELNRLRLWREHSVRASIEAGETIAKQELRIEELEENLATMHDTLWNAISNTAHLLPKLTTPTAPRFTKRNLTRIARQSEGGGGHAH